MSKRSLANSMRGGGLPSAIKTKSEPDPPKRLRLAAIPDARFELTWTFAPAPAPL